jgi:peptidoglycan hydrolase CwlO-like protein
MSEPLEKKVDETVKKIEEAAADAQEGGRKLKKLKGELEDKVSKQLKRLKKLRGGKKSYKKARGGSRRRKTRRSRR